MKPRILIVGTVPYKKTSPSRALDSFFHFWPREKLAQIYSDTADPVKGHCSTLFRITDVELIKRRFRKEDVGTIFLFDDLVPEESTNHSQEGKNKKKGIVSFLYKIGRKRTPLTHLARRIIWRKKYWLNEKLKNWVDSFKPDCIFLSISHDFFIQEIGLSIAEAYHIPIVCQLDDDYIFDRRFSINPLYYIYKHYYEKQIQRVMSWKTSAVYICNKIRDAYNQKYGIKGETIYLSSEITRRSFRPINRDNPSIVYFGGLKLDRYKSIIDIANALAELNPNYIFEVYSSEKDSHIIKALQKIPNIHFCGSIPYSSVVRKTIESDLLIIVEGFSKFAIRSTRFSLSTKVSDAIMSGANLFAYGSNESGAIDYLSERQAAMVCVDKERLIESLRLLIDDVEEQKQFYDNTSITSKNHKIEESTLKFENLVLDLVK